MLYVSYHPLTQSKLQLHLHEKMKLYDVQLGSFGPYFNHSEYDVSHD